MVRVIKKGGPFERNAEKRLNVFREGDLIEDVE